MDTCTHIQRLRRSPPVLCVGPRRPYTLTSNKNILYEKVGGIQGNIGVKGRKQASNKKGKCTIFRPFVGHYVCVQNIGQ